ncbi:helix-turn-helix domain-containing protein [Ramlibacter tataouinensis]|nr:helix-turn-helix domain-containing protein [Ramlibacter tataouinensis]
MKTLAQLAHTLEAARLQRRLTYGELADSAGLSPLAVRQALQGKSAPRITSVMALADKLGLEVVVVPKVVAEGLAGAMPAPAPALTVVDRLLEQARRRKDPP